MLGLTVCIKLLASLQVRDAQFLFVLICASCFFGVFFFVFRVTFKFCCRSAPSDFPLTDSSLMMFKQLPDSSVNLAVMAPSFVPDTLLIATFCFVKQVLKTSIVNFSLSELAITLLGESVLVNSSEELANSFFLHLLAKSSRSMSKNVLIILRINY